MGNKVSDLNAILNANFWVPRRYGVQLVEFGDILSEEKETEPSVRDVFEQWFPRFKGAREYLVEMFEFYDDKKWSHYEKATINYSHNCMDPGFLHSVSEVLWEKDPSIQAQFSSPEHLCKSLESFRNEGGLHIFSLTISL